MFLWTGLLVLLLALPASAEYLKATVTWDNTDLHAYSVMQDYCACSMTYRAIQYLLGTKSEYRSRAWKYIKSGGFNYMGNYYWRVTDKEIQLIEALGIIVD